MTKTEREGIKFVVSAALFHWFLGTGLMSVGLITDSWRLTVIGMMCWLLTGMLIIALAIDGSEDDKQ